VRGRIMTVRVVTLAVLVNAVAAAAYGQDPITTNATTWQTILCGTVAKVIVIAATILTGAPMALNQPGDHKKGIIGLLVGSSLILGAQTAVTSYWS